MTGTVGIGKSTIGSAVAERAAARGVSAAFLDVDGLSRLWPAPAGDPFRIELILTNLRASTCRRSMRPEPSTKSPTLWSITSADQVAPSPLAGGS